MTSTITQGADVDRLDQLALDVSETSDRIKALGTKIEATSRHIRWEGNDSARFGASVRTVTATDLAAVERVLGVLAQTARRNAAAQRATSADDGGAFGLGLSGTGLAGAGVSGNADVGPTSTSDYGAKAGSRGDLAEAIGLTLKTYGIKGEALKNINKAIDKLSDEDAARVMRLLPNKTVQEVIGIAGKAANRAGLVTSIVEDVLKHPGLPPDEMVVHFGTKVMVDAGADVAVRAAVTAALTAAVPGAGPVLASVVSTVVGAAGSVAVEKTGFSGFVADQVTDRYRLAKKVVNAVPDAVSWAGDQVGSAANGLNDGVSWAGDKLGL